MAFLLLRLVLAFNISIMDSFDLNLYCVIAQLFQSSSLSRKSQKEGIERPSLGAGPEACHHLYIELLSKIVSVKLGAN